MAAVLQQAQACHQAGRLAEAAVLFRQALNRSPDNFDALHLGAIPELQFGRPAQSLQLIDRALGRNLRSADAFNSRGLILQALGRHAEALALKPQFAEAHYNCGNALHDLK